ncbi:D-ribose ABC transporter substrate-binding protein [Paraoerskovia sediminicola]|uniref:D-ribose ABC transporter substrate-binding protein n=2 Tax=Paraoerskovia sediminicola TaxID=1138587 RepID=A0ABM8G1M8_9CELL|nr:D-ribose ABC transporter substrate-binding protein [Paraoerskovia sediminicola]
MQIPSPVTGTDRNRGKTMKFTSRPAAALIGVAIAATTLSACTEEAVGSDDTAAAGGGDASTCEPADVTLVGQVRNESNPYEASWLDGGDAFAEQVGLTQERLTYDGDSTRQQEQISQLFAGDTSCLVMNILPNGDSDTPPIVEGAQDAGAYLVTQWNKPADLAVTDYDSWLSHITYNGVESGKQIGDALAEAIGGSGGIVALQGILDTGAAKDRFAGLEESLSANSDVELLDDQTANFSRAEALEVTKTLLTKHGDDIKGIWAANDDMALGALEALKQAGRTDVAVVGIDAVPDALTAIEDGEMTATVSSDGPWQGGIGLAIGYCVATGELAVEDIADEDRAWYAEQFLIEKDNVGDFVSPETDESDFACDNVFSRSQGPIS